MDVEITMDVKDYFKLSPDEQKHIKKMAMMPESKTERVPCEYCDGDGQVNHDCNCELCTAVFECGYCSGVGFFD